MPGPTGDSGQRAVMLGSECRQKSPQDWQRFVTHAKNTLWFKRCWLCINSSYQHGVQRQHRHQHGHQCLLRPSVQPAAASLPHPSPRRWQQGAPSLWEWERRQLPPHHSHLHWAANPQ